MTSSRALRLLWFFGMALCLVAGCSVSPSEETARRFVDVYYLQIDLEEAQGVTEGLAREKIEGEIRLKTGQTIAADTRKPKMSYKKAGHQMDGEGEVYFFELRIQPKDFPEIQRKLRIVVRKGEKSWKVTQFSEG